MYVSCPRRTLVCSLLLFIAVSGAGGLWHQIRWNWVGQHDVSFFAKQRFEPVYLRTAIQSELKTKLPGEKNVFDNLNAGISTSMTVKVLSIRDGDRWIKTSGTAELQVSGQLSGVVAGDEIEFAGNLVASRSAKNPGEFDFYQFGRRQCKFCFITANSPHAIKLVKRGNWNHRRFQAKLRGTLNRIIWRRLQPKHAAIASAIILGNRRQLSTEQFDSFLVNGAVHVLAISGLHVGILASGMLFLGQLRFVSRRNGYLLTMIAVAFYCWLVEFRPPVFRATILISLYCTGQLLGRPGFSLNTLALAAAMVLVCNPSDILNTGAQLSFLAVASISFASRWVHQRRSSDPLDRLIEQSRSPIEKTGLLLWRTLRSAFMMSFVIWLVTMPLVAYRFNLVSPIGIFVNPLLMIPLAVFLYSGFSMLGLSFVFPAGAAFAGVVCEQSLSCIENILFCSRQIPGSFYWTAGPSLCSVLLFYAMLIVGFAYRPTRLPGRWLCVLFLAWLSFGWLLPATMLRARSVSERHLTVTFVDVGHGTSVIVQLPQGKTILYDCGSLGASESCARHVSRALWHFDISHLDAVVISHADVDHFNGLPGIIDRFSIGCVYVSQQMLDSDDLAVRAMLRILDQRKIPIRVLSRNDFLIDDDVEIEVLGPPQLGTGGNDNANSIVLSIRFGQRALLLPGDLEQAGMDTLLESQPRPFQVVMAPHHGSRNSRPRDLFCWANPKVVVVSGRSDRVDSRAIDRIVGSDVQVFRTERDGAITIQMNAADIAVRTWVKPRVAKSLR